MVYARNLALSVLSLSICAFQGINAADPRPPVPRNLTNQYGSMSWDMPGAVTDYPTVLQINDYNVESSIPKTDTYRALLKGMDDITERMADNRGTWLDYVKEPQLVYKYKTARLELRKPSDAQVWFWLRHSQVLDMLEGLLHKEIETGLNTLSFAVNNTVKDWRPNPIAYGSLGKVNEDGGAIATS